MNSKLSKNIGLIFTCPQYDTGQYKKESLTVSRKNILKSKTEKSIITLGLVYYIKPKKSHKNSQSYFRNQMCWRETKCTFEVFKILTRLSI